MIGFLQGRLLDIQPNRLLVDVQGVGYLVHIPLSTYYDLEGQAANGPVRLHIHTHVRDDAIELFGFLTEEERMIFERLIGVSGIGPRLAQVVLSGMAPPDLLAALSQGDAAKLTRIPGVGKKTAERMVLELREAAQKMSASLPATEPAAEDDDLVTALVHLGYRRAEAERSVAQTRRDAPDAQFHELLRHSLKKLSKL